MASEDSFSERKKSDTSLSSSLKLPLMANEGMGPVVVIGCCSWRSSCGLLVASPFFRSETVLSDGDGRSLRPACSRKDSGDDDLGDSIPVVLDRRMEGRR